MPRKALRCSVELHVHALTCPGVYLPHRDDVYLSIRMFGEHRKTQLISPTFPLLFHERFRVDKIFYAAFEPSHVASSLEIEQVTIELIQLTGAYGRVLASYTTNAKDFLYPYPSVTSFSFGTQDRDVLMDRSYEFPGIAPKLEFSTKTKITETSAPTLDIYDDLNLIRSWSDEPRYRSSSTRRSRSRTRSASPDRLVGRMSRLGLEDEPEYYDDEPRPPFVVRHVDSDKLLGRTPGTLGPHDRRRRSRSAGRMRAARVYGPGSSGYYNKSGYSSLDDDYIVRGRTSLNQPLTSRGYSYYTDEDRLGGYDDDYVATKYGRRIRAASPLSYHRRSLTDQFDDGLTPRYRDHIATGVSSALRRNRYDNPGILRSSYPKSYLDQELEDLKVDLELARARRDIEDAEERRMMFPGVSHGHHRDHFNSKLYNFNNKLYNSYNSYPDMYSTKTRPMYL